MGGKAGRRKKRDRSAGVVAGLRQLRHPPEFRISEPEPSPSGRSGAAPSQAPDVVSDASRGAAEWTASSRLIAELASVLWYLKTKHLKCEWAAEAAADVDARTRRTLGRIHRAVESLRRAGVVVDDPVGRRYPVGGEALMCPLQFLPGGSATFDVVSETVAPIVYRDDRVIQRAEVFVSVPDTASPAPSGETPVVATPPAGGVGVAPTPALADGNAPAGQPALTIDPSTTDSKGALS